MIQSHAGGIEDVADFPLVKMVMGEGGYQEEDESADIGARRTASLSTQPGYGTNYLIEKKQIEMLLAARKMQLGDSFRMKQFGLQAANA